MKNTNELYIALFYNQFKNENPYSFEPDYMYDFDDQISVVYKENNTYYDYFTNKKYKEHSLDDWKKDKRRIYKTIPLNLIVEKDILSDEEIRVIKEVTQNEYREFLNPTNFIPIGCHTDYAFQYEIDPPLKLIKEKKNSCVVIDLNTKERRN